MKNGIPLVFASNVCYVQLYQLNCGLFCVELEKLSHFGIDKRTNRFWGRRKIAAHTVNVCVCSMCDVRRATCVCACAWHNRKKNNNRISDIFDHLLCCTLFTSEIEAPVYVFPVSSHSKRTMKSVRMKQAAISPWLCCVHEANIGQTKAFFSSLLLQ